MVGLLGPVAGDRVTEGTVLAGGLSLLHVDVPARGREVAVAPPVATVEAHVGIETGFAVEVQLGRMITRLDIIGLVIAGRGDLVAVGIIPRRILIDGDAVLGVELLRHPDRGAQEPAVRVGAPCLVDEVRHRIILVVGSHVVLGVAPEHLLVVAVMIDAAEVVDQLDFRHGHVVLRVPEGIQAVTRLFRHVDVERKLLHNCILFHADYLSCDRDESPGNT